MRYVSFQLFVSLPVPSGGGGGKKQDEQDRRLINSKCSLCAPSRKQQVTRPTLSYSLLHPTTSKRSTSPPVCRRSLSARSFIFHSLFVHSHSPSQQLVSLCAVLQSNGSVADADQFTPTSYTPRPIGEAPPAQDGTSDATSLRQISFSLILILLVCTTAQHM